MTGRSDRLTLGELAQSRDPRARGAAALLEIGVPAATRVDELAPASVARTLAEVFARELERLSASLDQVYESAFLDTDTRDSLAALVERLGPCRPWWRCVLRRLTARA